MGVYAILTKMPTQLAKMNIQACLKKYFLHSWT